MIYLDNASTSWPKPDCVHEAMLRFMRDVGANPGRSGHRLANEAERCRLDAREAVAELFGVADPLRINFTGNGTMAINTVLWGLLTPGAHVVTTGLEHNAVMRPLRALEARGVSLSLAPCQADGTLDPAAVAELIRPQTRLVVVNHASNVCGTILPVREIGAIVRQRGVPLLVDAAQSAGIVPIDLHRDNIDLLAFTGHKGLLGPTGTGGLAFGDDFDIARLPPLIQGGTGSRSEHELQPEFLPDKYEAGTANIIGLAGLAAAVRYVLERGVEAIRANEQTLAKRLIEGLRKTSGVTVFGSSNSQRQTAVVSFNIAGASCAEIAQALDERFDIMCRPGLHCAPRAHRALGTFPAGTVRLSLGPFTTAEEVERTLAAVAELAGVQSRG